MRDKNASISWRSDSGSFEPLRLVLFQREPVDYFGLNLLFLFGIPLAIHVHKFFLLPMTVFTLGKSAGGGSIVGAIRLFPARHSVPRIALP